MWRTPSGTFGGCPKVLVIDNLRAAVKHPDWFDPELVPKLQSFCHHYGIVILPTKPYMPRHKGKVESGVKYVQNNALKARKFAGLRQENDHLARWEASVADTRIHGTTRQHVGRCFSKWSGLSLRPLPWSGSPCSRKRSGRSTGTATSKWPRRITPCRRNTVGHAPSGRDGTRVWCGSSISASSRSPPRAA